ncbi:MAG: TonB-dependent receptor plug domain-containing protein, partial [Henriciella sp.]|nr:TonB-dependent receptor plug domain-containing protein [Henriciella sp.]
MRFMVSCAAAALMASGLSYAEETEAEEEAEARQETVIVTGTPQIFGATKFEIPLLETPRSLSIITEDDFRDFGALAFSNTLNYTAGVTSNAFGASTRGDFTAIRGLDAPQYLDNAQVLFGFYNNARTEIYTLEQVEVLKGPASVLYGQAAPGGIVSAISKIAGPDKISREVTISAGSHDRYQAGLDAGFDLTGDGTWTARIVGLYRDADTEIDFVDDNSFVIAPSITYTGDRTTLSALFNYTETDGDINAQFLPLAATACGSSDVTIDPDFCGTTYTQSVDNSRYVGDPNFNRYDTEATTFTLLGTHELNDVITLEGTARYRDNEAEYDQVWISFLGDGNPRILPDGTAIGRTWYSAPAGSTQLALDARLRAKFDTGVIKHEVLGGVNYQDVETNINSALLYAQPTTFNIFNPVYDGSEIPTAATFDAARSLDEDETVATDIYLTDHMTIGNLVVNAGVRFSSVESEDAANDQSDEETPISIGALYKTDFGLNPYISYSESFRATVGTDVNTGGPLKPRKGEQTEVGFKYQPPGSNSYLIVAYFDLEENNLVEFVAGGQTQPGLTIEAEGFEVEALVELGDFAFDFDFRNQDAVEVDENGTELPRPSEPDTQFSLWGTWEPQTGQLAGFRA